MGSNDTRPTAPSPLRLASAGVLALVLVMLSAAATEAAGPLLGMRSTREVKAASSLAAFASSVKLNRAAIGDQEKVVISNHNLGEVARQGRISFGSDLNETSAETAAPAPSGTPIGQLSPEERWRRDYEAQQERLQKIERDVADYEERSSGRNSPYASMGAHGRLPGTRDPREAERERARQELEAERQRLEQMRRDARRQGYDTGRRR
jgi:hypothetical protein